MPSFSAFGYTNHSEKKYFVPSSTLQKAERETLYEINTTSKTNWTRIYVILILIKVVLKKI